MCRRLVCGVREENSFRRHGHFRRRGRRETRASAHARRLRIRVQQFKANVGSDERESWGEERRAVRHEMRAGRVRALRENGA